jgi:glutamate receptor, ionotropic, invertebrate
MYDAVHLFAKALHDLDSSQRIDIKPLNCDSADTWPHGYSLINYMKVVRVLLLTYN